LEVAGFPVAENPVYEDLAVSRDGDILCPKHEQNFPPHNIFDDSLAKDLVGKSVLIGITHTDSEGKMLRRSQIFGLVTIANRAQGICIRDNQTREVKWFPPDTRGIKPAPPGLYRNRATGEVVNDPGYLGSWTIAAAKG
jgi:hypothetical protein